MLLLGKSYANEQKCKQWRQQRFAYYLTLLCSINIIIIIIIITIVAIIAIITIGISKI